MVQVTTPPPIWPGTHEVLGATWSVEATNFAVYSPEATGVEVSLFDEEGHELRLPLSERTLGIWHGAVPGVAVGTRYGFRADGQWAPHEGRYFNPAKLLQDPYALAMSGGFTPVEAVFAYGEAGPGHPSTADSAPYVPRSVVVHDEFDWGDDTPPRVSWTDTVLYELHVRGFTKLHPAVPRRLRGTYAGLAHPAVVAYLHDLGVTAVELLPVHQFLTEVQLTARRKTNYWGYNSIGFFSPHAGYSSSGDRGGQVTEFKQMVKALHAAGIEVILDVVYNHTAESALDGPTLSFRGLDNRGYYLHRGLRIGDARYVDLTGCGNTFDASYPASLRLILDSLRYWVTEMHVDGFRFDLTSALSRREGSVDLQSGFLVAASQDPVLRNVKLVAEPWDLTPEGYLVGEFPPPWCEWNDKFRDVVRDFWRGRSGGIHQLATRLSGSSDLYADDGRSPYASVNFVTAHDGFTLRDLVSYEHKHNHANGEHNRDGTDDNRSSGYGAEGETTDAEIVATRRRQAANLMLTLALSAGVPMLTAGDERGRTQRGNNNPYVQDNKISWVDWSDDSAWTELYLLTRAALRLRRRHPALRQRRFFEGRPAVSGGPKDLAWIHPEGREMTIEDWYDSSLLTIGMFVSGSPLRAPGPRGERLVDLSFLLWLHAHDVPGKAVMPVQEWVQRGEVVLSTALSHAAGTVVRAGDVLDVEPRSLLVLRELPG
jgi:glycogen operon protein